MSGSLSQFKATQRRRADRIEKNSGKFSKKKLTYKGLDATTEYNFPTLETQELEDLKLDIKTKLKIENRNNFFFVLFISIVIAFIIYFFVLS